MGFLNINYYQKLSWVEKTEICNSGEGLKQILWLVDSCLVQYCLDEKMIGIEV